jgi:hypothetical protein
VDVLAIATWLLWLIAVALFAGIAVLGFVFLRGITASRPKQYIDPVCAECGTEFQVTRLGEVQVPRHCGEPMSVVRRPRVNPASN